MNTAFAGTTPLVRHILRRDRIRLSAWIVGVVLFFVAFIPVLHAMFPEAVDLLSITAMMDNPAMVAMVGPMFGTGFGAMYAAMMLVMTALIVGIMNIFLVTRHTRRDEEAGRLEVVRSLPIGRLASLHACLIVAIGANLIIALAIGFGSAVFGIEGMTLGGSMVSGFSIGATGMLFAGGTAVFCQLSSNTRTATSFSLLFLLTTYMLRAVGDVSSDVMSYVSLMGLVSRTEPFYNDIWWPVVVLLAVSAGLIVMSLYLASRRDLGQGIVAARPGRSTAKQSLSHPRGLALRLTKTTIWGAAGLMFILGAMYGSVMEEVESFIGGSPMMAEMVAAMGTGTLTENFVSMISFVMVVGATVPVIMLMLRVRGEEKGGYIEQVLAGSVSRNSLFASYFGIALIGSVVFPFVASFGMWVAMIGTMSYPPDFWPHLAMSLNYLPAIWMMLGFSALLVGYAPNRTGLAYGYLFLSFFLIYIGGMVGFPDAVLMVSPFGLIPQVPMEDPSVPIFIGLTAVSIVLMALGFVGYRRRDVAIGS